MLPNPGMIFTPLDPLPAATLNEMVENIEALQDGTSGLTLPLLSVDTSNVVDEAITTAKINDAAVTASKMGTVVSVGIGPRAWNSGTISAYTTTWRMGSAGGGVAQTNLTVNLAALAIPDNAVILQYTLWFNPGSNAGNIGTTPGVVYSITRSAGVHTVSVAGQWGSNDATAPNLTNSNVDGFIRYIA